MSRDSEAPRDEPKPLTPERLAEIRRAVDRAFRESERLDELVSHEYYLLADLISHVQRLEAEKRALESRCADREADKKALVEGDVWRASNGACRTCNAEKFLASLSRSPSPSTPDKEG